MPDNNSTNQQFNNSTIGNNSVANQQQNPMPQVPAQPQNTSLQNNQPLQVQRPLQPQIPNQNQAPQQPARPIQPAPVNSLTNNNQPVSNQHLGVVNQQPQTPLTYEQKLQQNIPQNQNLQPRPSQPSQNLQPKPPIQNTQIPQPSRPVVPQVPQPSPQQVNQQTNNTFRPADQPTSRQVNNNLNTQPREQFLTPNNINLQPAPKPQSLNEVKQIAADANLNNPTFKPDYNHLEQTNRVIQVNTFDILKLCIYIIPGLPLVILILRSIKDEEVMWSSRQSLVTQGVWLFVLMILNLIGTNIPLVSGNGFSLALIWNILLIGALIWAGAQAYMGKRWRIPLISDIGTVFIDGK